MKAPAIYRPVHLLAFVSLAGSSLAFSLMFYYGLHRMLSRRFPYAIYYEILNNVAFVVAVLPMRRDS